MRTADELQGKYTQLINAKNSPEGKVISECIKELMDNMSLQYVNEKGEEAVRAWGVIKGLQMAMTIDLIYKSWLPKSQIETVPKIIRP